MKYLIKRIRIKINDTSAFEFSDEEIISYIYEGESQLEMLLLSNRVKFNLSYLISASNICPYPSGMLEIYKVVNNRKEVPLKNINDATFGYYVMNNTIFLPCNNVEIYYIKEFKRCKIDDKLSLPNMYIDYIYTFAVIKALSRLEYNMQQEEHELQKIATLIVKIANNMHGNYKLTRYSEYAL